MVSAAHLVVLRAGWGKPPTLAELRALPAFQVEAWWEDIAPHCPSRRVLPVERRPGNALNIEIGTPVPRCMERSPDGRGAAWVASGGSMLAYGVCCASGCPLRTVTP